MLLAYERYMRIVWNREISSEKFWSAFAPMVFWSFTTPIVGFDRFEPLEGDVYCLFQFASRDNPYLYPVLAFSLVTLTVCSYFYGRIYVFAKGLLRQKDRKSGSETYNSHISQSTLADDRKKQRALLFRCLIVLAAFVTFYTPTFMVFVYKLITGMKVSPGVDQMSSILTSIDAVTCPLLFLKLNAEYQAAMKRHILGK